MHREEIYSKNSSQIETVAAYFQRSFVTVL